MVFSYLQLSDLSETFLKEKVIPFFHATYHNDDAVVTDGRASSSLARRPLPDAYTVFVDTGDKQYPYPDHLADPPASQFVTLIIVWKNPNIFNNYRGDVSTLLGGGYRARPFSCSSSGKCLCKR